MTSKHLRHDLGYTAPEALILLVVLAVLAMTSLAVYHKLEAEGLPLPPSIQPPAPEEPAPIPLTSPSEDSHTKAASFK